MSKVTRPAIILNFHKAANLGGGPFNPKASFFHSTAPLDRKRRTHWDSGGGANSDSSKRSNYYARKGRKLHSKQELLRNVSSFAEHLFQSWQRGFDDHDPAPGKGKSWFTHEFGSKRSKGSSTGTKGPYSTNKRTFDFCDDDSDVETIFRSGFRGGRYFYCSFVEDDFRRSGFSNNFRTTWKWSSRLDEEEDNYTSSESESSESDVVSDRLALGLHASGPLKMDDVKNAYRVCAMKWHPDRHQGISKAVAEEKFKACSAAYQSLCDKLAIN